MTRSRAALGWGAALVALGAVLLARNVGALPDDVAVWPWALVAVGVALLVPSVLDRRSAGEVNVPLALLLVGGVFVLRDAGLVPAGVGVVPVLLIGAGVLIAAGGLARDRGRTEVTTAALPAEGVTSARVELTHGAGTLRIRGGAAGGMLYEGTFAGSIGQESTRSGAHLDLRLRQAGDPFGLLRAGGPLDWELLLADDVAMDLDVRTGASRVRLDLESLQVRSLKVATGASDVQVVVPGHGTCHVEIEAGGADVEVRVPDGVAASVRTSSALAGVTIDPARFPRENGLHRSPGFAGARDRVEIDIEGGLASFAVR